MIYAINLGRMRPIREHKGTANGYNKGHHTLNLVKQ